MTTSHDLSQLIESCLDEERILAHSSKLVGAQLGVRLTRLAAERRHFSEELESLGGPAHRGNLGSWGALGRELGNDLMECLRGSGTRQALEVCCRSQRRTELSYVKALEHEWPPNIRVALTYQLQRLRDAAAELAEVSSES